MDSKGPSEGGHDSIWTVDVEQNKVGLMRVFVEREDPTSKEVDDLMLRRFLRARNLDIEKASALFLKYLKWRRAAIPNGWISESEVKNQLAEKKMFMQGFDKKGRRIGVVLGGKHQSYKRDFEEFKRFVIYTLEKLSASMQNGQEKFIAIGDLEGWGYSNCDIRAYIAALDIMQNYYPERLAKVFLVHVPYIFWTAWKIVYPFIDDNTKKKFIPAIENEREREREREREMEDRCLRSQICQSPSVEDIRTKLLRIVRCHEESKAAFQQLKSQIKISLLEAEDVFASLSIPLMRLVGIKTEEMEEEGRSTCVLINPNFQSPPENSRILQQHCRRSTAGAESATRMRVRSDRDHQLRKSEEDSYSSRAEKARRELEEKQRLRLHQLVFLLRQIEKLVNSRQAAIVQSLDDHRLSLRRLFQKATSYLFNIRRPDQPIDPTLVATFKLLRATFEHVGVTLGSVEDDVEAMVQELAEKMCEPMAVHVKGLRADMERGPAGRLVGVVEEMEWAVREKVAETEVARKKAKASEEETAEVVRRSKEFEEKVRGMKEFIGLFMEAKRRGIEPSTAAQKHLAMEKDQSGDDKLLWNILNQKKQRQQVASPVGPTLLYSPQNNTLPKVNRVESYRKNNVHGDEILTMGRPSRKTDPQTPRPVINSPRAITRSYSRRLVQETHRAGLSLPQLGPSPSFVDPHSSRSQPSIRSTRGTLYS